jgi:hypothetical protein
VKREEIRLETQHDVLLRICGNKLFFPRIDNPQKILDCGYGRGDWAGAVAEEYQDCEVRFSPFEILASTRVREPAINRWSTGEARPSRNCTLD